MDIEVTDEAVEVLRRSLELTGLDPAATGVRLRAAHGLGGGVSIQLEFATDPAEGEVLVEAGGLRLFVPTDLPETVPNPVVAVEPQHDRVVVRPRG